MRTASPQQGEVRFDGVTMLDFNGWRVGWYIPGTLLEPGPWPGSLYARLYPNGEPGISSVPQVGITIDNRDQEPAPSSGYFAEASLRGAHPGARVVSAGMSGSGSACFALLPEAADAGAVAARVRREWGASAFVREARIRPPG